MGIQIEFNPDLALRAYGTLERDVNECLPQFLETGNIYEFRKSGQRVYFLRGEIPLRETTGEENLSKPLAAIRILEYSHRLYPEGSIFTEGIYQIIEVFNPNDSAPKFNGLDRIK